MGEVVSPALARRESRARTALVAAYREGLGLAAVVVTRDPAGIRMAAAEIGRDAGSHAAQEIIEPKWWCRRAADAERLAAAVHRRLRRGEPRNIESSSAASVALHDSPADIATAVENVAERLGIVVYSDQEISREADGIIARVEDEIGKSREAGEMKAINQAYRSYRMNRAARGEKVLPYAEWLNKYKQNVVRQLAAALRYS